MQRVQQNCSRRITEKTSGASSTNVRFMNTRRSRQITGLSLIEVLIVIFISRSCCSVCTPKGVWMVEGFGDFMPSAQGCKFVTWFHSSREIALHSHADVPDYPASRGCVRLSQHAAQLIHNNAVAGRTRVIV
jgi:hypothetical protein